MKKTFFLILILITVILIAQEIMVVKRNHAVLREGPGSFYPVVTTLKIDTQVEVLQKKGKWYQIRVGDKTGFISSKVFKEKKNRVNPEKMGESQTEIEVAQSGLTAGVKGFAERFSKKLKADETFINYFMSYNINPKSYKKFRKKHTKKSLIKKPKNIIIYPLRKKPNTTLFQNKD